MLAHIVTQTINITFESDINMGDLSPFAEAFTTMFERKTFGVVENTHEQVEKLISERKFEGFKYVEFHGPTQSKKTKAMISLVSHFLQATNYTIAYVNPNLYMCLYQLQTRLPNFATFNSKGRLNSNSRVIVVLDNASQLAALDKVLTNRPYILIIDEVDDSQLTGVGVIAHNIQELHRKSVQTFGITATNISSLWLQKDLTSKSFFYLVPCSDYKGLRDVKVHYLNDQSETISDSHSNVSARDAYFFGTWLRGFSKRSSVEYLDREDNVRRRRPRIALYRGTSHNNSQLEIFKEVLSRRSGLDFVIVHNQTGYCIFAPNLGEIPNCEQMSHIAENYEYIYYSSKIKKTIGDILQTVKDLAKTRDISIERGLIITGKFADRCISYFSNDGQWHLDHMYAVLSRSSGSNSTRWIQILGRITGVYQRSSPTLHLWVHREIYEECLLAMQLQEAIHVNMSLEDKEIKTTTFVQETVFPSDVIPRYNLATRVHKHMVREEPRVIGDGKIDPMIDPEAHTRVVNASELAPTTVYYSTYTLLCDILKGRSGRWILQSDLIVQLMELSGVSANLTNARCKHLRFQKSAITMNESTRGLLFKKEKGRVYVRFNT
jgi:hypothetical protein